MTKRVFNFYAGPATLPLKALEKARDEFLDFAGTGMSVLEISHRTKPWQKTIDEADALVREVMGVPNDYKDRSSIWYQPISKSQGNQWST